MTKAVVGSAALRIRENLVGLGSLLEPLRRVGILGVDVGVKLARELAERLLDLRLIGLARDAKHLIRIACGHYDWL